MRRCFYHNPNDTKAAIQAGYTAGTVLNKEITDDEADKELRLGFDFDSVIADDESEQVYQKAKEDINEYFKYEQEYASSPLSQGPIGALLQQISYIQEMEKQKVKEDSGYQRILKTSIITARNAPAHERVVTTLKNLKVEVDEAFFLGGIDKSRILNILKPHIFFDDQMLHLDHLQNIPAVHIPFGISNE